MSADIIFPRFKYLTPRVAAIQLKLSCVLPERHNKLNSKNIAVPFEINKRYLLLLLLLFYWPGYLMVYLASFPYIYNFTTQKAASYKATGEISITF